MRPRKYLLVNDERGIETYGAYKRQSGSATVKRFIAPGIHDVVRRNLCNEKLRVRAKDQAWQTEKCKEKRTKKEKEGKIDREIERERQREAIRKRQREWGKWATVFFFFHRKERDR